MRNVYATYLSLRLILSFAVLSAIGLSLSVFSPTANAAITADSVLSYKSPNASSNVLDGTNTNNITRHILLNSDHGNVHSISLGMYYTNTTAKTVKIVAGDNVCKINTSQGNSESIVRVRFTPLNGGTAQDYFVQKKNFCTTSGLYKSYTVPTSLLKRSYDPVTQRYAVLMTASFVNPARLSTVDDSTATFSVIALQGLVGYVDTDKSTGNVPNNSLLGNTTNAGGYITAVVPFGLPCNVTTGGAQTISFYDSDNGQPKVQPKNLYYYIEEQQPNNTWKRLNNTADYTANNLYTTLAPGVTGITPFNGTRPKPLSPYGSQIKMKNMKPLTRYRLVIKQLRKQSGAGSNYVYVGLPGASIFGATNFTCRDDYELEPTVDTSPQTVEAGAQVQVVPSIDNNSNVDAGTHSWQVAQIKYAPGTAKTNKLGLTGSGNVCGDYTPNAGCIENYITPNAGQTSFPPNGSQPNAGKTFTVPDDTKLGTTFCFVASVESPTRSDSGRWAHSEPSCFTVGKKPKLQIWGYDAKVMGDINTSLSLMSGKNYGSYGEYGLLSDGLNTSMASGNGLLDGGSGPQAQWSALTFANQPGFGNYNGVLPFSPSNTGMVEKGSNVTINTATTYTAATGPVAYHYTGTLMINQSLKYTNTYSSINQIPRVLIFADNVVVGPNATQIDPWIITNNLSTCSQVKDGSNYFASPDDVQITAKMCDKSLMFNGPVIANNVYLYRTAGEGKTVDNHAEVFNLRPDAFLSSYAGGGTASPIASTDVVTEVPPRF